MRHPAVTILCALMLSGGAVPAGSQPASPRLTLAEALARARDGSPEGAAARARVEAAQRAAGETATMPNPTVEFRSENWASGVSRSVLPLDAFAEITQIVELGGKRDARKGMAEADLGAMQAHGAVVLRALAIDISRAYLDALRFRERQRTLSAQGTDLQEMVRILDRRVAIGTTAELDLLKLRTEEARLSTDLLRTEVAAQRALVQLTSRVNVEADLDALETPPLPALPIPDDEVAIKRRPDVLAAERAVVSAQQALRLEDARGTPDPALNAGYKRTGGFNTGLFTVTMPLPLWDRNRVNRILAQGQVTAAELDARRSSAGARRARGDTQGRRTSCWASAHAWSAGGSGGPRPRRSRCRAVGLRRRRPRRPAAGRCRAGVRRGEGRRHRHRGIAVDAVAAAIEARLAGGEDALP